MRVEMPEIRAGDFVFLLEDCWPLTSNVVCVVERVYSDAYRLLGRDIDDREQIVCVHKGLVQFLGRPSQTEKVKFRISKSRAHTIRRLKLPTYEFYLDAFERRKMMPIIQLNEDLEPIDLTAAVAALDAGVPMVCLYE